MNFTTYRNVIISLRHIFHSDLSFLQYTKVSNGTWSVMKDSTLFYTMFDLRGMASLYFNGKDNKPLTCLGNLFVLHPSICFQPCVSLLYVYSLCHILKCIVWVCPTDDSMPHYFLTPKCLTPYNPPSTLGAL